MSEDLLKLKEEYGVSFMQERKEFGDEFDITVEKKILFSKKFLQDIVYDSIYIDGVTQIEDVITGKTRWQLIRRQVFKIDGRYFASYYREMSTENGDEEPYEYEDDFIEVTEVKPRVVERTIYF